MPQKTWVVGEEVLAADFNTYVQQQVVARFATVAARDSAYPAATAGAGAMAVTTDTGTVWVVVGTTWQPVGPVTPWTAVTFQNSWANAGGATQTTQYRKVGDDVEVRLSAGTGATNTVAFTLPVGFRPPATIRRALDGAGAHAYAEIAADGTVRLAGTAAIMGGFLFSTI